MRRISFFILSALLVLGCAKKPAPDITDGAEGVISQQDSLKLGVESMQKGLEAQDLGDREAARQAFFQAGRHFSQVDKQGREIMHKALSDIKKIVDVSAFEYAPKDSFNVLLVYLKMQNAYMDGDLQVLSVLGKQLDEIVQKAQETTVQAKQKRIEDLSLDVAQKREEIKSQGKADVLEVYPDDLRGEEKRDPAQHCRTARDLQRFVHVAAHLQGKPRPDQGPEGRLRRPGFEDPAGHFHGGDHRGTQGGRRARPGKMPKEAYTPRRK